MAIQLHSSAVSELTGKLPAAAVDAHFPGLLAVLNGCQLHARTEGVGHRGADSNPQLPHRQQAVCCLAHTQVVSREPPQLRPKTCMTGVDMRSSPEMELAKLTVN